MRRCGLIFLLLLIVIVFLPNVSSSNENDLLRALLKVKYSGDNSATLNEHFKYLVDAEVEYDLIKSVKTTNHDFINKANECISYYKLGRDIFQQGASMSKSGQHTPNTDISKATSALQAKQSGNACVEQLLQMPR
ncbi:MAG: hypothetical protein ABSF52_22625 [Syntrophobacteraceae bacterium]